MTQDLTLPLLLAAFGRSDSKSLLCSQGGQVVAVSDPLLEYSHSAAADFVGQQLYLETTSCPVSPDWSHQVSVNHAETRIQGQVSFQANARLFAGLRHITIRPLKVASDRVGFVVTLEVITEFPKTLPQNAWLQLFRDTQDGVCLFDESLNILSTNQAFDKLSGGHAQRFSRIDQILRVKNSFNDWFLNSTTLSTDALILTTAPARNVTISITPMDLNERQLFWCSVHDLSSQIALEKMVEQSTRRFDSLFENNIDGIALANEKGIYVEANQRFADILGVEVTDIIGRHFTYFNANSSYELPTVSAAHFVATGYVKPFEKRFICRDGTEIPVGIQLLPHYDSNKKFDGTWNFIRPLDQQSTGQLNSAYQYESLFNQSYDAIAYSGLDGKIILANKAFCDLLERPLADVVGQSYAEFTCAADIALEEDFYRAQLLERHFTDLYDKTFLAPSGAEIATTTRSALVSSHRGIPEGVWAICRDARPRKKLMDSLAISEHRFRSLFSNSSDAIGLWTPENELQYVNKAYLDLVGYSQQELRCLSYRDFTPPGWEEADALLSEQVKVRGYSDIVEKEILCKDGSLIPITIRAAGMHDDDHKLIGSWVIIRDISDHKVNLRQLQHSQNMLEQTSRMSRVGGWELNVSSKLFQFTDETYRILSIPGSYHVSVKNIAKLLDNESAERIDTIVKRVLADKVSHEVELRLAGFSPERWIRVSAELAYEHNLPYLYGAVQDISDFKRRQLSLEVDRDTYQQMAFHDPLTKLPNRLLLEDRYRQITNQARRLKQFVVLMVIDLDDFKTINDRYGHPAGDALLAELAGRLRKAVRASDTVARLGGDEFVVIAMLDNQQQASQLARKLINNVAADVDWQDNTIQSSCSIGGALSLHYDNSFEQLYAAADAALYDKKSHGKAGFSLVTLDNP
ncbi:PAS domain S-box protein [Reinekea sp.]|jgi:diguanylate cyclase (GGDEF)-like protein/PAS domain S-box-containing protein|uniref:PAS domain S-box protein n=1 Tax=Reinekea sp. TaxID=1970455 RepID=UPI002A7ED24C|nr:PAS domain S-box protein [Reinekea sp.]